MNIIGKKYIYFVISLLIITPGLISLILFKLNLGLDFTGGTLLEIKFTNTAEQQLHAEQIRSTIKETGIEAGSIQQSGDKQYLIRMKEINKEQNENIMKALSKKFGKIEELQFAKVDSVIGRETLKNALKGLVSASVLIVLYIAWSFRKVPKPASSWRFGVCAIVALLHDVLVVVGIFSLLGHFMGVEIDSLFVTALLTVIGFSVHDTIVVFDRIRENLRTMAGRPFAEVVNESIIQTLNRSLNTSLTVIFVLVALLLFGGTTIRWFIIALLVGIISGTYSSIFNAAPLLVVWHEWSQKRAKK